MLKAKDNYLRRLRQEQPEWIPMEGDSLMYCGFEYNSMEKGPMGGGFDGFGVKWAAPESGGATAIPEPGYFLLDSDNIENWRNILTFPDVAAYHWEQDACEQLEGIDREEMAVDYGDGNGPYERLAAFMGFEEALLAIAEEPEAVEELLAAITDYKLACMEYIAKYYQPDTYTLYDDVATQMSPFMSPAAYRNLIKPQHKRLADRAKELGMIPILHCCGKAECLVEDFIDEGWAAWSSVQPCNDIIGILNQHGHQICLAGGYDTNGPAGATDDPEKIQKEIERCCQTYGDKPGYIFAGFILVAGETPEEVWGPTGTLYELATPYTRSQKL